MSARSRTFSSNSDKTLGSCPRARTASTSSAPCSTPVRPRFHVQVSDESPLCFGAANFDNSPSARALPLPPLDWIEENTPMTSSKILSSLRSSSTTTSVGLQTPHRPHLHRPPRFLKTVIDEGYESASSLASSRSSLYGSTLSLASTNSEASLIFSKLGIDL